jgi:hypothetical protein
MLLSDSGPRIYHVMGMSHTDPRSLECLIHGCIANLRIPDGTPESTIQYLQENSGFNNKLPVIVEGPLVWDCTIPAFHCVSLVEHTPAPAS